MNSKQIKMMVTDAVLVAMYFVLSTFVSINLGNIRITLDGFPILVGALLFGPVHGLIVGLLGSFLNQLLTYGITPTTILWMLPAMVRGLMVGGYALHKRFELTQWQTIMICASSAVVVTAVNTLVMYLDSIIYQYYSYSYVFGMIIPRIFIGIATGVLFALIIPMLMKPIRKSLTA